MVIGKLLRAIVPLRGKSATCVTTSSARTFPCAAVGSLADGNKSGLPETKLGMQDRATDVDVFPANTDAVCPSGSTSLIDLPMDLTHRIFRTAGAMSAFRGLCRAARAHYDGSCTAIWLGNRTGDRGSSSELRALMQRLPNLESVFCSFSYTLVDLAPLALCPRLMCVDVNFTGTDVSPLAALPRLKVVCLRECGNLLDAAPLAACRHLASLHLKGCGPHVNVSGLAACVNLGTLILTPHRPPDAVVEGEED